MVVSRFEIVALAPKVESGTRGWEAQATKDGELTGQDCTYCAGWSLRKMSDFGILAFFNRGYLA